jgi:hypothetical protein
MKVKDLINKLKSYNQNDNIIFYHLKNNDLEQANVESIVNARDYAIKLKLQQHWKKR